MKAAPKVMVIDLRKGRNTARGNELNRELSENMGLKENLDASAKDDSNVFARVYTRAEAGAARQITQQGGNIPEKGVSTFASFREALRSEVVKYSGIILKDGGAGELRLVLKPEELGNVRINLRLNNNHIEGRIIVENNTVKEIFESSLQSLSNGFKDEGYETASLEVFVKDRDGRGKQMKRDSETRGSASKFEKSIPILQDIELSDWIISLTI